MPTNFTRWREFYISYFKPQGSKKKKRSKSMMKYVFKFELFFWFARLICWFLGVLGVFVGCFVVEMSWRTIFLAKKLVYLIFQPLQWWLESKLLFATTSNVSLTLFLFKKTGVNNLPLLVFFSGKQSLQWCSRDICRVLCG